MNEACRLLLDPPSAGAWNMAVDETLLEWAAQQEQLAWRFYQWEAATLSLGYFQEYDDRRRHAASLTCPVVRRASGGGAIVHDRELTYCVVVPAGHRLAAQRASLYQAVHASLIDVLASLGVHAAMYQPVECPTQRDVAQPFLCFQRRACGDVVAGEAKVAGSAQRRCQGAVLQHGSVLLGRSPAAPELAALDEMTSSPLGVDAFRDAWLKVLAQRLDLSWRPDSLDQGEIKLSQELVADKYASPYWTQHRRR